MGKSTLLQHVFGRTAEFVVFDPVIDVENARRDPELFLNNHRTHDTNVFNADWVN